MPLRHLLYRCPTCGHDPTSGVGDVAECPACGASYRRGRADPARILVVPGDGAEGREVPPGELVDAMEELGGPRTAARAPDGSLRYEAEVETRRSEEVEIPLHHRGEVLGFVERLGDAEEGRLVATADSLSLLRNGDPVSHWNHLDIGAIQASSSALQVSTRENRVFHFRFVEDSPKRWEDLLRWLVAEAYRREGRGEVVEFQPRIVTR